jgi:hypothetical protein
LCDLLNVEAAREALEAEALSEGLEYYGKPVACRNGTAQPPPRYATDRDGCIITQNYRALAHYDMQAS